jgi:hypothetical protein
VPRRRKLKFQNSINARKTLAAIAHRRVPGTDRRRRLATTTTRSTTRRRGAARRANDPTDARVERRDEGRRARDDGDVGARGASVRCFSERATASRATRESDARERRARARSDDAIGTRGTAAMRARGAKRRLTTRASGIDSFV